MTDVDDILWEGDDVDGGLPYSGANGFGRYGHYRRPHPITGAITEFPRVSTVCKAVKDTYALHKWQLRMAAKGLSKRPELLDLVVTMENSSDLDALIARAQDAAGVHEGADKGTTIHSLCEYADLGQPLPKGTRKTHIDDVNAYRRELSRAKLSMLPGMVERSLFVPGDELGCDVMGRLDRVGYGESLGWPEQGIETRERHPVCDLKTSQHDPRKYSAVDVVVQMSLYSRATHYETEAGSGVWEPVPVPVDQELGLIISLPAGSATCKIYKANLVLGWELAKIAVRVRELNSAAGKRSIIALL